MIMDIEDLVHGQKYIFRRHTSSNKFEPATFLGCDHLGIPTVQFCLDDSLEELPNAMFDPSPQPMTREWLQREMLERGEVILGLKAESDLMFNLLKEVK
jgi:hypothetical protein